MGHRLINKVLHTTSLPVSLWANPYTRSRQRLGFRLAMGWGVFWGGQGRPEGVIFAWPVLTPHTGPGGHLCLHLVTAIRPGGAESHRQLESMHEFQTCRIWLRFR